MLAPAKSLTTWVLLAIIGLAVRTALSPSEPVPLGTAAAEPQTVSLSIESTGAPADNTASAVAIADGDPAVDGDPDDIAAAVDEDATGRLARPNLDAGAGSGENAGSAGGSGGAGSEKQDGQAAQKRPCVRNHALGALLASYCRLGTGDVDLCCANDDGFCSTYLGRRCDSLDDNDCRIFEALLRAHEFLRTKRSSDGYTPDPRQSAFESKGEYFRLVPCMQAQGYLNLYFCTGDELFLKEALDRLNFIEAHLDEALTQTPYDGQLGWAFLDGYRATCDERYLSVGLKIAGESEPNSSHVLNWGVLEAMNLLRAHDVTGQESQLSEAATIVDATLGYQNPDGSFPHQTHKGARSLPYTAWLARDLGVFSEDNGAPAEVETAVDRAGALLEEQLAANGSPKYEGDSLVVVSVPDPACVRCAKLGSAGCADYCDKICPGDPEAIPCSCITDPERDCPYVDAYVPIKYYDDGNADYDVRGWTSELPATAAVLDRTGRFEAKWRVLGFLFGLQNSDGSFPDKWGYVPRLGEPMWLFATDEHSVIRTSSVFYYLSGMLRPPDVVRNTRFNLASGETETQLEYEDSAASGRPEDTDSLVARATPAPEPAPRVFVHPNPSFGAVSIDYDAEAKSCLVQILDVSGRLVTELGPCANPATDVLWNGRDSNGVKVPPGVYFVKLKSGSETSSTKLIILGPNGES